MEHYRFEEVADGVLAAISKPGGGGLGNAGIVAVAGVTIVFDTGMTPQAGEELRRAAEALGPVRWVVNSHRQADRETRGAERLAQHRTMAAEADVPGHGEVATIEDVRTLRDHLRGFLDHPDEIEQQYPDWDFQGELVDRNRTFLRERAA